LGHALVGLGVGAATVPDARSPWLARGWLGTALTLAYWPDVLEWLGGLLGWSPPHSAFASLLPVMVSCAALVLLLRLALKETSRPILAAACGLVFSHLVLDLIDGGIPIWWPFSSRVVGPDWIPNGRGELAARVSKEVWLFVPVAAAGLAGLVWRCRAGLWLAGVAAVALQVVIVGSIAEQVVLMAAPGGVLVAAALVAPRRWPRPALLWQVVPAVPVLVLAAVQFYAEQQMRLGLRYQLERDYVSAQRYYARCARLRPIGHDDLARYLIQVLDQRLRGEEAAWQQHLSALAENPDDPAHLKALAELYLTAGDPGRRNPAEALRLAERLAERSESPDDVQAAQRLLERARRSMQKER